MGGVRSGPMKPQGNADGQKDQRQLEGEASVYPLADPAHFEGEGGIDIGAVFQELGFFFGNEAVG